MIVLSAEISASDLKLEAPTLPVSINVENSGGLMSATISFRLDDPYLQELLARTREGESRHERARRILMDALDQTETEQLREDLAEIKNTLRLLNGHLAIGVEALLITAGNYPKDKARDFVNRNIRER